jgi:hypothetical protein
MNQQQGHTRQTRLRLVSRALLGGSGRADARREAAVSDHSVLMLTVASLN